ncbi:unnamed protein product, partial [Cuscuta campestris]
MKNTVGSSHVVPESVSAWGNYENMTWDQQVVYDAMAPNAFPASSNFNDVPSSSSHQHTDDINTLSDQFLKVLKAADEPLYPDCDEKSTLAAVSEILSIKSDWNLPEACLKARFSHSSSFLRNTEKAKQRQYYGGRRSVSEHIKKMEQEDKVVPNQLKVINRLFVKKGSQPSQEVAKIKKDYKEKLLLKKQAASGSGSNSISLDDVAEEELEDDLGLYVEVVGNNKNRVFGRGCEAGSSESLSSGGTSHEDYAARLKTELELKLEKKFEAKFQEKNDEIRKDTWTREPAPLSDAGNPAFRNDSDDEGWTFPSPVDRLLSSLSNGGDEKQTPNPNSGVGDLMKDLQDDLEELDDDNDEGKGLAGEGSSKGDVVEDEEEFDVRKSIGMDSTLDFE